MGNAIAQSIRGLNFLVVVLAFLGRFQFIRLLSLGPDWSAYSLKWERIPLFVGLTGFLLSQSLRFDRGLVVIDQGIVASTIGVASVVRPIVVIYGAIVIIEWVLLYQQYRSLRTAKNEGRSIQALWGIHSLSLLGGFSRIGIFISVAILDDELLNLSLLFFYVVQLIMIIYLHVTTVTELPSWVEQSLSQRVALRKTWSSLLELLKEDAIYLNARLSLSHCADLLQVSEHHLRSAIKHNSDETFKAVVNWFRLKHFVHLFSDLADTYTIETIAEKSGFNSRSTLHRTCQYWFNMSPSEVCEKQVVFDLKILSI